jgi:hypothetical protein
MMKMPCTKREPSGLRLLAVNFRQEHQQADNASRSIRGQWSRTMLTDRSHRRDDGSNTARPRGDGPPTMGERMLQDTAASGNGAKPCAI